MALTNRQVIGVGVWFLLCGGIWLVTCWPESSMKNEQAMIMAWILIAIGFPSTLAGCMVLAAVGYGLMLTEPKLGEPFPGLVTFFDWAVLSACGAIQWFIITPWIWKTLMNWFSRYSKSFHAPEGDRTAISDND